MKTSSLSIVVATLLLGGVAPSFSCACGSSSQTSPTSDAALPSDSGTPKNDGGFLDLDAGTPVDAGPRPTEIGEDGWATFYGVPAAPLRYPVRSDAFPPPVVWEPCNETPGIPSGSCRRMRIDIPDPPAQGPWTNVRSADVEGNTVTLVFEYRHANFNERNFAAADGPFRAVFRTNSVLTELFDGGAAAGRYSVSVNPNGAKEIALVAGKFGEAPRVLKLFTSTGISIGWLASPSGVIERRFDVAMLDWESGARSLLAGDTTDAARNTVQYQELAGALYVNAGLKYQVYKLPPSGPTLVLAAGRDAREVGSFAVSDRRIAWTSIVKDADNNGYSEEALYVQDFTNGALHGTRGRLPQPGRQDYSSDARFGCDVLARHYREPRAIGTPGGSEAGGLEIFDFRTMRTWRIPTELGYERAPYPTGIGAPLAVTCKEIFTRSAYLEPSMGRVGGGFARLEIAKLGPGTPFVVTPDPVP